MTKRHLRSKHTGNQVFLFFLLVSSFLLLFPPFSSFLSSYYLWVFFFFSFSFFVLFFILFSIFKLFEFSFSLLLFVEKFECHHYRLPTPKLLSHFEFGFFKNINNKNNNDLHHTILFLDEQLNKRKQFTRKVSRNFVPWNQK